MAGTVRKRGKSSYYMEYMYNGERYSQTVKATSLSEANRKLALFVSAIEKGQYSKESNITFVEFAQLFLDKYAVDNLSPTTVIDYKSRLNKYILNDFGKMKLSSIRRLHVQEFANKLVKEYNLSSKTAKNYVKLISSILGKAVEWEYLQNNVADKVSIPKNFEKPKKKVVLYSYDETRLFLDALEHCEDKELQMAIYSSFVLGGRRGEILSISTGDINFDKLYIDIVDAKIKIKGGVKIKDTKNEKERRVYVPKTYMDILEDYIINYLGNPSTDTIKISLTPLFLISVSTFNQYLEVSFCPIHIPNTSLIPSRFIPIAIYAALFTIRPSVLTL